MIRTHLDVEERRNAAVSYLILGNRLEMNQTFLGQSNRQGEGRLGNATDRQFFHKEVDERHVAFGDERCQLNAISGDKIAAGRDGQVGNRGRTGVDGCKRRLERFNHYVSG